jgi:hypothetical protein
MPDKRKHRGPHPEDGMLFHPDRHVALAEAVRHLSWLMSHDYAVPSAIKLVGDRFQLTKRQRIAVQRCACSDAALAARQTKQLHACALEGSAIAVDGYNLLTTVEAALAGAVILVGRDGCYRDMASMHGSYRHVDETRPAIEAVGKTLESAGVRSVGWYLDSPVSNSGRLKAFLLDVAGERGWTWSVDLVGDPDKLLSEIDGIIVTADSVILDRCRRWFNVARAVVDEHAPDAVVVDLSNRSANP